MGIFSFPFSKIVAVLSNPQATESCKSVARETSASSVGGVGDVEGRGGCDVIAMQFNFSCVKEGVGNCPGFFLCQISFSSSLKIH